MILVVIETDSAGPFRPNVPHGARARSLAKRWLAQNPDAVGYVAVTTSAIGFNIGAVGAAFIEVPSLQRVSYETVRHVPF